MLCFLGECVVIQTGFVVAERVLQLDVYGKFTKEQIKEKVIEVAKEKCLEIPVIVLLKSFQECDEIANYVEHSFVFGEGDIPDNIDKLKRIKECKTFPIVFTTPNASLGHDFT